MWILYISNSLCSILCWCTFGRNYSLKSFWIWRVLFEAPLKLHQVGWEASMHSHFQRWIKSERWWATQGHPQSCPEATPLISWLCAQGRYSCWEMNRRPSCRSRAALEQVFIQGVSCIAAFLFLSILTISSSLWKTSPQHDAATTVLHSYWSGDERCLVSSKYRPGIRSLWANSSLATLP